VATTKVIAGYTTLTRNFAGNLFGLNPKTSENYEKKMGPLQFFSPADAPERKKERGPRRDDSGGGARSRQ